MLDAAAAAASPLFMGDDYDPPVDEDEGMEELPAYMADEAQHDMGSVRGPHPSQQAQHGRMPAYAGGRCLGAQAEPEVHAQQQVQRQRQQQRAAQEQQQQQRQQLLARQDDNQGERTVKICWAHGCLLCLCTLSSVCHSSVGSTLTPLS